MLISRQWLSELLTPGALPSDDAALCAALTSLGLEVEGCTRHGDGLDEVVVAEIVAVAPHPGADRLRVVQLHDGRGVQTVVCGASNVPAPGGKVAYARPGTVLPGGLAIGAKPVRGVDSAGMIASEAELDIGGDDSGILVLPIDTARGQSLAAALPGVRDTVVELSVTPNRPDALGHVGVARDLAVRLDAALQVPQLALPAVAPAEDLVALQAPSRCGRYYGVAFEHATVAPSPAWARVRLHRLGLRALSNVVDVTNLVLMLWGQPLHAFDRAQLAEGRVVVRCAREGERMILLDDRELTLSAEDLVIADAREPMALAGIMGGQRSGVASGSSTLLLEAAWFAPAFVRRSARRHGVLTDSSHRFERGVDHGDGLRFACAQACAWLSELCGARPIALQQRDGELPPPRRIVYRPARAAAVLGLEVPSADAQRILAGVGVALDTADAAAWRCVAPSHRPDLEREVDLIDEVVRHYGLDRLPMRMTPPSAPATAGRPAVRARQRTAAIVTDALRECGLHELVQMAFGSASALAVTGDDAAADDIVRVTNPMRTEAGVLRTHLLPGMLDAVALNLARHGRPLRLFECGRVYRHGPHPVDDGPCADIDRTLPHEPMRAAVVLAAPEPAEASPRRVGEALLHALARLGSAATVRVPAEPVAWLHPGAQAEIVADDGVVVGRFGRVHPRALAPWSLPRGAGVCYGELWLERLPDLRVPRYAALPRFPASARDLSLDVAVDLPAGVIIEALQQAAIAVAATGDDPPRLVAGDRARAAIEWLEDYRGEGIAAGRRAVLLRLHYRAQGRSITDEEVHALHMRIVDTALVALAQRDGALRRR
ncbi:MAG: phenylalanine--tRNA ligase subunit beta [Nannocystaceae bacterium]|nr:phenylalanine--tRNA ligase subunit beta [Nannocystaceae bacterium]